MNLQPWRLLPLLAALSAGCQPKIGDSCTQNTDCSADGTRFCEPNMPDGYCTIFNCEPNTCPDEAVCVAYQSVLSTKPECADQLDQRLERTFCMRNCSSNGDCRAGYACIDLGVPNPWGAVVVDGYSPNTKVCTVALTALASEPEPGSAEVCSPPVDASFPPVLDAAPDGFVEVPDAASRDAGLDARAHR